MSKLQEYWQAYLASKKNEQRIKVEIEGAGWVALAIFFLALVLKDKL